MVGGAKTLIFFLTLSAKQGNVVLLPENTEISRPVHSTLCDKNCNRFHAYHPLSSYPEAGLKEGLSAPKLLTSDAGLSTSQLIAFFQLQVYRCMHLILKVHSTTSCHIRSCAQ